MNWITLLWPMAIAACLTLGVIHAQIARRLPGAARAPHLFFSLSALGVALTGGAELVLLHTHDLGAYRRIMRWAELPIWLMLVSLAAFTRAFLRAGSPRLARVVAGLATLVLLAHLVLPEEHSVRHADAIRTVTTLGGVPISVASMRPGSLAAGELAVVVLLVVFVTGAARAAWRRGERHRAVLVGGGIVLFLAASRLYALQVELGRLQTPFFFIFPFLGLLLAMARELSLDVIRAARLAEDLAESERRMDLAARAAALGFWVWDLRRDTIWANAEARRLFGVPEGEPVDFARFLAALEPAHREPVRRALETALAGAGEYEMEYRVRPADGAPARWISARGRAEAGPDGRPALMRGVVLDVTERKAAQLEAEAMRRELVHVSRVTTLGELAASMAHELNQPLAAILSNAQAARRFLAAPAPDTGLLREILDDIIADDKRAGEVIHRLRALVQRREHAVHERLDLNELVRDVGRLLHGEFVSRNVVCTTVPAPDLPAVTAGRVEIQQVLLNLLVNAMDALRDAGRADGEITVRTLAAAGAARVEVHDNGPGVPAGLRDRVFQPFFTTKANGLGMGLAICRTILESAGGSLRAGDSPSGGACFTLELPAA